MRPYSAGALDQPAKQAGGEGMTRERRAGPELEGAFIREGERSLRCMADKKESIATAVAAETVEIVVEHRLVRGRLDLHPGGLAGGRMIEQQVDIDLAVAAEDQLSHALEVAPNELRDHARCHIFEISPQLAGFLTKGVFLAADAAR